jgi:hypothetical protein
MLPDLPRPKQATIYALVGDLWENNGSIQYVAHAITAGGTATRLRDVIEGSGKGPANHPDQLYWDSKRIAKVAGVQRIEIDCTLMPCDGEFDGCLFRVPALVAACGYANIPLRIFSHRDEGAGGGGSTKRYFLCNTGQKNAELKAAFAQHGGWGWTPWNGTYA